MLSLQSQSFVRQTWKSRGPTRRPCFYAFTGFFSPRATDVERAGWDKSSEDVMDLEDHALSDSNA